MKEDEVELSYKVSWMEFGPCELSRAFRAATEWVVSRRSLFTVVDIVCSSTASPDWVIRVYFRRKE